MRNTHTSSFTISDSIIFAGACSPFTLVVAVVNTYFRNIKYPISAYKCHSLYLSKEISEDRINQYASCNRRVRVAVTSLQYSFFIDRYQ